MAFPYRYPFVYYSKPAAVPPRVVAVKPYIDPLFSVKTTGFWKPLLRLALPTRTIKK